MSEEPYLITNPSRKHYKFTFRVAMDNDTLSYGMAFVKQWLADKNYTIKRERTVPLPGGMFQIRVWLN